MSKLCAAVLRDYATGDWERNLGKQNKQRDIINTAGTLALYWLGNRVKAGRKDEAASQPADRKRGGAVRSVITKREREHDIGKIRLDILKHMAVRESEVKQSENC